LQRGAGRGRVFAMQMGASLIPMFRRTEYDGAMKVSVTADEYVASVVRKYAVEAGPGCRVMRAVEQVIPAIRSWAGECLLDVKYSGSYAKGTAISLGTDVDLFISLDEVAGQGMPTTVKEMYWGLFQFCADRGLKPRAQNVSIRVTVEGVNVDLVPGRKQKGSDDHSLYRRKKDSWVQTNVDRHIRLVTGARCGEEIRAMKVWRERYHVEWPSFYLELVTVGALREFVSAAAQAAPSCGAGRGTAKAATFHGAAGRAFVDTLCAGAGAPPYKSDKREATPAIPSASGVAARVMAVLQHVGEESFLTGRVMDPANTNNNVADDMDLGEKRAVMNAARTALQREWEQILW
jgi:hypothetical protein